MRLDEITVASLRILKGARRVFAGRDDIAWHQTGTNAAKLILAQGFKTGKELGVGESCGAIFFTKTFHRDVSYARGEKTAVYIPVALTDLKLIDNQQLHSTVELHPEDQLMVDKGIWTEAQARQYRIYKLMDDGDIPIGYDGILMLSESRGYVRKIALTQEAANRGLAVALNELRRVQSSGL